MEIDTALSAREALQMHTDTQYDVIISDYQMPGMDGIAFLKTLRARGDTTPFIIFTGKGREEVVVEALNAGADFYLQKGGDPKSQFAELTNAIRLVVSRKQMEEALHESETRYREFFTTSRDSVFITSPDGRWIDFNNAILEMFGYDSREELSEVPVSAVYAEEGARPAFHALVEREGYIKELPGQGRKKDGTVIDILITTVPVRNPDGSVKAFIGTIRDVTEQKRAKEALKESEEKYRILTENAPIGILTCDRGGQITYLNPKVLEILGSPGEEKTREINLLHFPPLIEVGFAEALLRSLETGISVQSLEAEYTSKWGKTVYFRIHISPLIRNGSVQGAQVILDDITQQKRAEEALKESEEQLNLAIEGSGVGLWDWQVQTGKATLNERWADMIGYTLEELSPITYETCVQFCHPDDLLCSNEMLQKHFAGEIPLYECEARLRHKDGHWVWVLDRGKVVEKDSDGRPARMTGTLLDITERKRVEDALLLANNKLNILTSVTLHDINNQLTILQGHLTLAANTAYDPGEQNKNIQKADAVGARISQLISFMREYQKIGAHTPVWHELGQIIDNAIKDAPLHEMKVENHIPGGLYIFSDPLIQNVFYNILDNAVRHGDTISSIRFSADKNSNQLVISCEDDGIGIPPGEEEKIFGHGYGKNSGLGLFLTRQILGITGISIRETGEEGKGARFEIAVPEGMYRMNI